MVNRKMLRQAQQLQKNMLKMQEELESATIEGSAGGGAVRAVVSGKMRVESITIDPDAVSPEDVEILQDLVLAAVNDGLVLTEHVRLPQHAVDPTETDRTVVQAKIAAVMRLRVVQDSVNVGFVCRRTNHRAEGVPSAVTHVRR